MKPTNILIINLLIVFGVLFTACKIKTEPIDILLQNIDTTVKPSVDFFKYANGTWLRNNPIPESESEWGITNLVKEEIYSNLHKICDDASKMSNNKGSINQKIGDFFYSGMDTVTIEKTGIKPLKPELDKINDITTISNLLEEIAVLQTWEVKALFSFDIGQDFKNSEKNILVVSQGGFGLPNRDYYFNKDLRNIRIREKYVKHLKLMFELMGEDSISAKVHSKEIMNIETELASQSRKLAELRDPYKNYNKLTVQQLNKITPSIKWESLLQKMGVNHTDSLIVKQPEFFAEVEKLLKTIKIEDWKAYLKWKLIDAYANKLNKSMDYENFEFYGKVLGGSKLQRDRWKRILDQENGNIGELLGQLYVQKYFSASAKLRYEKMVDNIFEVYKERIEKLDWMSDKTKQKSIYKLSKVTKKIGYPNKWKDYSDLEISREAYVQNVINANKWAFNCRLKKLDKPVDRLEWTMKPQTYNAYYNVSNNEIVIPAAIFDIPGISSDSLIDDALAYSHTGYIIGHEITHGFDDSGRKFDAKGNLVNWWTKEDEEKFNLLAKRMVRQFDNYVVLDSIHVNGKACLGENIADLAGIILSYEAFEKTEQAKLAKRINGFTPEQRFFLSYAFSWVVNMRHELLARKVMSDVHAPDFLRVNGPLSNLPEFYNAFNVKPGDPMYRPDSLRVWIW